MYKDRKYRSVEPSDLPLITSGKLKAFYCNDGTMLPAMLIGTRFNTLPGTGSPHTGWMVRYSHIDHIEYGNTRILVDVTPEKRYAVWNHNSQRFVSGMESGVRSRGEAEAWIQKLYLDDHQPNFYIVEWEIKNDE